MNSFLDCNVIINGSEGFVGSYLKNKFSALGINFQCADLLLNRSLNECKSDKTKSNFLIHLAASISPMESFEVPGKYYRNNIDSVIESLEWARTNNAKIIFFSSYVYGSNAPRPTSENDSIQGHNPYSQSKLIGEDLCRSYQRDFNVPYIIFRPFNIYGYGQSNQFVISSIFDQINNGKKKIKIQNPYPKRDFIYIKDVVEAIPLCFKSSVKNQVFNLCSGKNYSIREVCEIIKSKNEENIEFIFNEKFDRKGDVSITLGDYSKINTVLGWEPKYSLERGITEIYDSE